MREPVVHVHTNARGERVRILGWPAESAKATILVHHGLGEHIGRYQTFADNLPDVSIWGYDARGHGEFSDKLGHAEGLDELAADLYAMVPVLLAHAGVERAVLVGHSMGGAVCLTYMTRFGPHAELAGLVISAPPVALDLDLPQRIKVLVGRILAKLAPAVTLASGLPQEGISSVPAEVERYRNDPMVHDRLSLALARSLVDDAPDLVEIASRIELPSQLLQGSDDPIAIARGARQLHEKIPDSRLEIFEGARHEIHHETPETVERFFGVLNGFLDEVLGS